MYQLVRLDADGVGVPEGNDSYTACWVCAYVRWETHFDITIFAFIIIRDTSLYVSGVFRIHGFYY
jgi:hypothetical protein